MEINEDKYRIITSIEEAKAWKCYWKNGKYISKILEQDKYKDMETLYTREEK